MAEIVEIDSASSVSGDSALGSDLDSLQSASISASVYNYKYENGRRYHAYRDGAYVLPNDEAEQDRLDLHHHIYVLSLGGALHKAPLPPGPLRVLDFGTGTGIWAIDFADERPDATVTGTDLSAIQPTWVPPNCKFYVEDIESDWIYRPDEAFDYIHGRGMGGSVSDWPLLYTRALEHLKPGGWLEMQEYEAWISSDDDPEMNKAPHTRQWQHLIDEASRRTGKRLNVAHEHKQHLINAGFEDVQEHVIKIPIGPWAKDKRLKEIGRWQRAHMCACVDPFTLALYTRVLGWSLEETYVTTANVRREFKDPKLHLLTIFHYVTGRRPMT